MDGRRLLVVEDVVTSGGQLLESTRALRGLGATVSDAVCVVDREADGAANLAAGDVALRSLFTATDLRTARSPAASAGHGGRSIRVAGVEDAEVIAALRAAWHSVPGADPAAFARSVRTWLAGEGERRTTCLAMAAGEAAGMVSCLEHRRMPVPAAGPARWCASAPCSSSPRTAAKASGAPSWTR